MMEHLEIFIKNVMLPFLIFTISACSAQQSRILSTKEMEFYHLNGVINDAPICPTVFDDKLQALKISGSCEYVNCRFENNKTICIAQPAK